MEKEYKLSEESAREQMQVFMDSYRINAQHLEIENGKEWVATVVNNLVEAIQRGNIEVQDSGVVRHILAVPKGETTELVYRRLDGIAIKAADRAKGTFEGHCALMGSLCTMPESAMVSLDPIDISIMQKLAQLFMAS